MLAKGLFGLAAWGFNAVIIVLISSARTARERTTHGTALPRDHIRDTPAPGLGEIGELIQPSFFNSRASVRCSSAVSGASVAAVISPAILVASSVTRRPLSVRATARRRRSFGSL